MRCNRHSDSLLQKLTHRQAMLLSVADFNFIADCPLARSRGAYCLHTPRKTSLLSVLLQVVYIAMRLGHARYAIANCRSSWPHEKECLNGHVRALCRPLSIEFLKKLSSTDSKPARPRSAFCLKRSIVKFSIALFAKRLRAP